MQLNLRTAIAAAGTLLAMQTTAYESSINYTTTLYGGIANGLWECTGTSINGVSGFAPSGCVDNEWPSICVTFHNNGNWNCTISMFGHQNCLEDAIPYQIISGESIVQNTPAIASFSVDCRDQE